MSKTNITALLCQQTLTQLVYNNTIQELDLLNDDDTVYKMIGPALVKQDIDEGKANVNKRLSFIGDEIKRIDTKIADLDAKIAKRQQQMMQLQQEGQRMQHAAQAAAQAAQG